MLFEGTWPILRIRSYLNHQKAQRMLFEAGITGVTLMCVWNSVILWIVIKGGPGLVIGCDDTLSLCSFRLHQRGESRKLGDSDLLNENLKDKILCSSSLQRIGSCVFFGLSDARDPKLYRES